MVVKGKVTTDPHVIESWVTERKGRPGIARKIDDTEVLSVLCISFPDDPRDRSLKPISWDEFFETFQREKLVFIYQERTGAGELSCICEFV